LYSFAIFPCILHVSLVLYVLISRLTVLCGSANCETPYRTIFSVLLLLCLLRPKTVFSSHTLFTKTHSVCGFPYSLHECNFNLLLSFQNIVILPHFLSTNWLSLYYDVVLHLGDETLFFCAFTSRPTSLLNFFDRFLYFLFP
jgi:hypothetical protein